MRCPKRLRKVFFQPGPVGIGGQDLKKEEATEFFLFTSTSFTLSSGIKNSVM